MNNEESKIIVYLLQNQKNSTGKFNFSEMSKDLNIPFDDVVATIKKLQKENLIKVYCPECSKNPVGVV